MEEEMKDQVEENEEVTAEEAAADKKEGTATLPSGTMVMCDDEVERPVITREDAIAQGFNRYFTGIQCRNGHMAERKVKGYVCVTCARIRMKARRKERLASDPDFKAKAAAKRTEKHRNRYANDPGYKQRVLDRAKRRRQAAAAERASKKAQAEAEIKAAGQVNGEATA